MDLILKNPYRTVGLIVGAKAKEQTKQISRLKKYIEAEQEPQEDFSFPVLGNLDRTINSVDDAASKLNLDSDKIIAALFWFWNGNKITDEAAFDALKDGNIEEAIEIWTKLIFNSNQELNKVSKRNASAFFNLSTIHLSEFDIDEDSVRLKLHFLDSEFVKEFICEATDETFKISKEELQICFLNSIINQPDFDTSEFIDIINNINFGAKQDFIKGFIQIPIDEIEQKIETVKNKRKASKLNAAKAGQELHKDTVADLKLIESIATSQDQKFLSISDKVANEILQCSIDYFNYCQDNDSNSDYTEVAMKLAKQAECIAKGKLAKERIQDSINTLEEMKNKEILQALKLLRSIKDTYTTNERKIREQVKQIEETDLQIKLGYKTINWLAVEDNIKNSINWQKLNELLISMLDDTSLKKIKESEKSNLKNEFLELAIWLKEKSQLSSTISAIITKYKKIPPKLPFRIVSSVLTNTDNNPLYTKFIRYISLNLNIEVTENKSVDFYLKYIKPDGTISRNQKISPKGYTLLVTKDLNLNNRSISLSGWGSSDVCTYDIGENKIEVYIDDFLIHSKSFSVDLAPSEKLQKELMNAEIKLKEISNKIFFKTEIDAAISKMNEIMEFKLFRSSSTKLLQISEQQKIITNLQLKASIEKKRQIEYQNNFILKLKSDLLNAEY